MSRKLHKFQTVAEYQAYSASTDYTTPCVAVVEENNVIYYDYGNNKPQPNYTDFKVSTKSLVSDGGDTYGFNETLCVNYIPSGITNLSLGACTAKKLELKNIPNTITRINWGFYGASLTSISGELPDSITDMGWAFQGCDRLVNIDIKLPNSVEILNNAFDGTKIVTSPEIPSSAKNINGIFQNCSKLITSPPIPNGVTDIGFAFNCCSSLKEVTLLITTPLSYDTTFAYCDKLETIYVPDEAVDAYKTATGWLQFADKIKPLSSKPSE